MADFSGISWRSPWLIALLLAAAVTSFVLWRMQKAAPERALEGPPRADYSMVDFELVALNESGQTAFVVSGPYASRRPFVGSMDIDEPRFELPAEQGAAWQATSGVALIDANATQITLRDDVRMVGQAQAASPQTTIRTESITVEPEPRTFYGDDAIRIQQNGSILSARGFRGQYDTRHIQLLNEVHASYDQSSDE